jgi:TonB family protein
MEQFIHFLLRASVYLLLFAVAYQLLFRKQESPGFNRLYLLGSSMMALALALLPYNYFSIGSGTETAGIWVIQLPEVVLNAPSTISETSGKIGASLGRTDYFLIGYFILSSLILLMLIWRILQLVLMVHKFKSVSRDGVKVVLLPNSYIPFSFFNWVFIPENISEQHYARVLAHERAHCLKRHSWDVLFYELLFVFFWFHPSVYFLRHEAKTLHEYEADHLAMRQFNKADYQQTLLACALAGKAIALANPFNVSPLKKRIMKMNQKTDSSLLKNWIKVGLIMPFVLIAVLLQSCFNNAEEESDSKEPVENELQTVIEEKSFITSDTLFTVVEVMPEFPGGSTSMIEFVKGNLSYPADAKEKGIEGRVFVNFVVETDGSISNAQILRGIGGGCDEEAVRVVAKMPNWTPGYQRGQAVRVSFNMPILFALNGKE